MTWEDPHLNQLDLFDVGERVKPDFPPSGPCTPFRPGTGPPGEKCGSCHFKDARHSGSGKRFLKCRRMISSWTRGKATDVKARWPACYAWEPAKWPVNPWSLRPDDWSLDNVTGEQWGVLADYWQEQDDDVRADLCRKLMHTNSTLAEVEIPF